MSGMPPPDVPRTNAGSVPTSTAGKQSPLSRSPSTRSPGTRSPGSRSPLSRSPLLKPLTAKNPVTQQSTSAIPVPDAASVMPVPGSEGHDLLAEAISKIDELRLSHPPTPATTPPESASASNPASRRASQVGALQAGASDKRFHSPPATPHFGAQSDLLRQLDNSTKVIRQSRDSSDGLKRAPSVSGIGGVVEKPDYSEAKIVVAMVGLPARGKSYLSNKMMRYLRWLEYNVEVFNVGQLRRSKARETAKLGGDKADHSATFFSDSNADAKATREQLAEEALESLIEWLKKEGNVGIMDATNSTHERRAWIRDRVAREPGLQLMFLESVCDDPDVIATNIALKASSGDPDYAGMSREEAIADFRKRIEAYERVYETVSEPDMSYCRILNVGSRVTINRIDGYLQSRMAFYLMNLHLKPRSIYLSRHGESMYNVQGKIGGDAELSPRGRQYMEALPSLVKEHIGDVDYDVWTSTLTRTIQTASHLPREKKQWKALDELDAGVCDGMTYEEIEEKYPEDYEARDDDKFNYRYRGGESYRDVVVRLEPVIMELERADNVLIIGHQAIIRCLYAYFMGLSQEQLPYINVPLHTLIRISPRAYGCLEERFPVPIASVDTHRPKPSKKGKEMDVQPVDSTKRDYFGSNTQSSESATSTKAA
ncbi:hypothetical protein CcaverHIS002_0201600 [Cutaneotrichosporon cavernicola]|uniref:fructose-2,6-bisphosphate 2-phosphatase n=1 Tax=Cutaneotrichosporon cavernicola TaxID=279322 RepID=A0AA48ID73_9TREE|nr:uncharacterized protein CcaverHIS019_0201630 [Cutaneotrichosporon cavernicola]BEI81000.1 hypothetical protein CcaverHIS002_0201600 [Cutaneotrichosporon cavernicola]BEI88801.1 hypothetical protein CcaverHIS019_0201630 [Cutaneotrichosporon cavernicola]